MTTVLAMGAAVARVLPGLALTLATTAGATQLSAQPPDDGWRLEIANDGGVVVLATNSAITVTTEDGVLTATSVVESSGWTSWRLATDDPGLTIDVAAASIGDGTTHVTVTATGPRATAVTDVGISFAAIADEQFFGLGERAGAVDHRGTTTVNRVSDGPWTTNQLDIVRAVVPYAGFSERADATYFPVPWVLSTSGYGVLVDGYETSMFDLADRDPDSWTIDVVSNTASLRVFTGATPAETLGHMTAAIGRQPAPAAPWMFGPWWQPADDDVSELAVLNAAGVPISAAQTFTHYLPCGDHVDRDADERARVERLHDAGLAVTTYVNPMVCVGYRDVYVPGSLTGAFTLDQTGLPYRYRYFTTRFFDVVQFDFSSPAGVELFHGVLDEVLAAGYDGWMEDFGEYTPDDAVSADGTPGPAMHNRYPELYHATSWSFVQTAPRPLIRFNRSGWTGAIASSQVVWGGDPTTAWGFDGLQSAVRSGLGMGMSGVSLWGSDIGGFFTFAGEQPTPELLARWVEFGAFSGVMRLQSGGTSLVEEPAPTILEPAVLDVWRRYSQLRTQLYPYIAGSEDAYDDAGLPLMRHHALATPHDELVAGLDSQYLFGADLLVAPVTVPGASSQAVFLPDGAWTEWWPSITMTTNGSITLGSAVLHEGGQSLIVDAPLGEIPLFVRSGAIIPLLPTDVDTLSPYGADDVVGLDDRESTRTILAFPESDWSGPLGPGETVSSTITDGEWQLRFDALVARTYAVQATLAALPDGFIPCRVTVDDVDSRFDYNPDTRVLRTTVDVPAVGVLAVTACPGDH